MPLRSLHKLPALILCASTCFVSGKEPAPPNPDSLDWLKKLSLDELTQLKITSVSKRPESRFEVPSAIYVVTQEDIRRSPANSMAETLRNVPGMHVARFTSSSWAISARGFNNTAANKLEVLMDGRSLYTPLLSEVFWDVQDTVLEDLDRVEILRGPGAAIWGENSVNGVVNFVSKPSWETQGLLVSGGAGTLDRGFGTLRYGGRLHETTTYRIYAKALDQDEFLNMDGTGADNSWKRFQTGFRMDSRPTDIDLFTLQGDTYYGLEELEGPTDASIVSGGNVLTRWSRELGLESRMELMFYYDRIERKIEPQWDEDRDTYNFHGHHYFPIGEHQILTWGIEVRRSADRTHDIGGSAIFIPENETTLQYSLFAQDQVSIFNEKLQITLGSRLGHNDFSGWEFQPSLRLAWLPTSKQTLWGAVSRAVRIPTRFETDVLVQPGLLRGNEIDAEEVLAYEIGYRIRPADKWSVDLALFYHKYDNLRTFEFRVPPPGDTFFTFDNGREGESYGVESSIAWQPTSNWRLIANYTHLQVYSHRKKFSNDTLAMALEGNDPRHILGLISYLDLPGNLEFDSTLRHVSAMQPPSVVPSYWELDLRLAWRPNERWEFAIVGRNLLDNHHPEFAQAATGPVNQVPRSAFAKVTFRY